MLEEHGLKKGDFDAAQTLINDCRKSGMLPLDICVEDGKRQAENLERLDDSSVDDEADAIVSSVAGRHRHYTPVSFWEDQPVYIECLVEKIDLKSLFGPVCADFNIPITNAGGWTDLNCRAAMMRRFKHWEAKGRQCVLLYCGDHDPGGLQISGQLRSNLAELSGAVGWSPERLKIDRFGLNYDFIQKQELTWIDNLRTAKKKPPNDLADPKHPDHKKAYVQDYLEQFGPRKCEANALVTRQAAARQLCLAAITRYLPEDAPESLPGQACPAPRGAAPRHRRPVARQRGGSAMSGLPIRHVPAELVDKLSKIAGLLGSSVDGERSAAAYRATALIRAAGLTWAELIHAAGPREPKALDPGSDWRLGRERVPRAGRDGPGPHRLGAHLPGEHSGPIAPAQRRSSRRSSTGSPLRGTDL